jgi:hypothetical protein
MPRSTTKARRSPRRVPGKQALADASGADGRDDAAFATSSMPPPWESCRIGDPGPGLRECSEFLAGRGEVRRTMERFTRRLEEAGIPYAVIGAMALNAHGFERVTTDLDVVVTAEDRKRVHELLDGRGFVPPFAGSRNLRDTANGVKVDLLRAGDYAGNDDPKPIVFPDPRTDAVFVREGVRYVVLERLLELKLASGMSNAARPRDLGDSIAVIGALRLPRDFGERLHPWVRAKWYELWDAWDQDPRKDMT